MAWKWYEIKSYKVSTGEPDRYYGGVQLFGKGFYALLKFHKEGPLPNSTDPVYAGDQRFYGHLDFQQLAPMVDLLRNESPINFGWDDANPNYFHLMTGQEAVGEGDGYLAAAEAVTAS
jgi:hypothetical protein